MELTFLFIFFFFLCNFLFSFEPHYFHAIKLNISGDFSIFQFFYALYQTRYNSRRTANYFFRFFDLRSPLNSLKLVAFTFLKKKNFGQNMEFFKKVDFWLFLYAVKNLQNMVKYSKGGYFRVQRIRINNLSALKLYFDLPWRF